MKKYIFLLFVASVFLFSCEHGSNTAEPASDEARIKEHAGTAAEHAGSAAESKKKKAY